MISWEQGMRRGYSRISAASLDRFLTGVLRALKRHGSVDVLLACDGTLARMNQEFRGKKMPTDVLSFPAAQNAEGMLGDLAISVDTAARQAREHGHSLDKELRILLLHGALHLAGHDHERDNGEMRALEQKLRAKFGLPSGLIERSGA